MQLDLYPNEFIVLAAMVERFLSMGAPLSEQAFSTEVCERLAVLLQRAGSRSGLCTVPTETFKPSQKPDAIVRALEALHREFIYVQMRKS